MKTEKTEMIMKYFDVTYKVAKQYEVILKDKQLWQIKAWYETKKGDETISAESEEVLKEILNKGKILKKVLDKKSWWQPYQESIFRRAKCTYNNEFNSFLFISFFVGNLGEIEVEDEENDFGVDYVQINDTEVSDRRSFEWII